MKITPITEVKNAVLRRTLTVTLLPLAALVGLLILIPIGAVVDMLIAVGKFTYKSFIAIFVKFPMSMWKVEAELVKFTKQSIIVGWRGPAPVMPKFKAVK